MLRFTCPLLIFSAVLGLLALPAAANFDPCSAICSLTSPCDQLCATSETCDQNCLGPGPCDQACIQSSESPNLGITTCGAYGVCAVQDPDPPTCTDPKSVRDVIRPVLISGPTVVQTKCHDDHWYLGVPWAHPRLYDVEVYTYRDDTVRITEYCDGTESETLIESSVRFGHCARRSWAICFGSSGPAFPTCN